MKWRLTGIKIVFVIFAGIVLLRLSYWQVVKAADLRTQALGQRMVGSVIPAPRGEILDSESFPLATNKENYLLTADPKLSGPISAAQLVALTNDLQTTDSASLITAFAQADKSWVPLFAGVSAQAREKIAQLGIIGLGFEPNPVRYYPDGSISGHLLGFVGKDENGSPQGYFGLEGYYDKQLSGRDGKKLVETDALNRPIVIGDEDFIPPQSGRTLQTSIDRTIQYFAYQKLQAALEKYGASSGTITVMEPKTGNILAMVSLPGYDPADYANYPQDSYKNPNVAESYEPGSTFKVVIMAAALDAKVVQPSTVCSICAAPVTVSDYTIRTWNDKYYAQSTLTDVIQHSDNVGMVFTSRALGQDKMLAYIKKFGFGKPTGIDLEDESSPSLRQIWHEIDYATASFGQGIAVTPIQMVQAVGALANHGKLIPPRIVTQIIDGDKTIAIPVRDGEQVVSPIAAGQITKMMVNSVDNGEAKWAKPKGYSIAGKTGTAQIPVSGHYDATKTIASFVGFAPADDPKFVMLVTLREPKTSQWGSETAAPLWFDVAAQILRYYQVPPMHQ